MCPVCMNEVGIHRTSWAPAPSYCIYTTYLDVVLGPVHTADGHGQTTQAALVHVAGDGAAEARVATQPIDAWSHTTKGMMNSP